MYSVCKSCKTTSNYINFKWSKLPNKFVILKAITWIHQLRHSFNISALFKVHLTNYVDWRGTTLFLNICVIRRIRQIQCDNFPDVLYAVKCKYKGKSFVGFIPLSYDFTVRMCTVLYVDKMIIIILQEMIFVATIFDSLDDLTHYGIPVLYKPSTT